MWLQLLRLVQLYVGVVDKGDCLKLVFAIVADDQVDAYIKLLRVKVEDPEDCSPTSPTVGVHVHSCPFLQGVLAKGLSSRRHGISK